MLIVVVCCALIFGYIIKSQNIEYNNVNNAEELITISYPESDIKKLKKTIASRRRSFFYLKSKFKVQCIRKTHQGYYVLLFQDDGKKVFVFINDSLELRDVLVVDNFKTKKDFDFIISKQESATIDEIVEFDSNTILLPISSVNLTVHMVEEGLLCIEYKRNESKELTVDNLSFIDNKEMEKDITLASLSAPYILEIDKVGKERTIRGRLV